MTDEYGDDQLEEYDLDFENLDEAFNMLYDLEDEGDYAAVVGRIVSNITTSKYVTEKDGYQVARHLTKKEIDEGRELTEELLEPEE